jgi:hypothetical protein
MLKLIYEEARQIARSTEQLNTTHVIAELAASAALARNPNSPVDDVETNSFIEQHLR